NAVNPRYLRVTLNGDSVMGPRMDYYDYVKATKEVPVSLFSAGTGTAQVIVTNRSTGAADRMVLSKISIEYPRIFRFSGLPNFKFHLPANPIGNYLEITGLSVSGSIPPVLLDITNGKRYSAQSMTPPFKFRLEGSATNRE